MRANLILWQNELSHHPTDLISKSLGQARFKRLWTLSNWRVRTLDWLWLKSWCKHLKVNLVMIILDRIVRSDVTIPNEMRLKCQIWQVRYISTTKIYKNHKINTILVQRLLFHLYTLVVQISTFKNPFFPTAAVLFVKSRLRHRNGTNECFRFEDSK